MSHDLHAFNENHYKRYKHNDAYLAANGPNAHIVPNFAKLTVDVVLRNAGAALSSTLAPFVAPDDSSLTAVGAPSSAVAAAVTTSPVAACFRVGSLALQHACRHFLAQYARVLVDGGDQRFFFPERAVAFRDEIDGIAAFFCATPLTSAQIASGAAPSDTLRILTDVDRDWALVAPVSSQQPDHSAACLHRCSSLFQGALDTVHCLLAAPTAALIHGGSFPPLPPATLPAVASTAFWKVPAQDAVAAAAYNALPETNDGHAAGSRVAVRRVLLHRKDKAAKKHVGAK
jgi:hypothetical protein